MTKLIATLTYLQGDFIKRTTAYRHVPVNDEWQFIRSIASDTQSIVAKFATIAGNRGECTIGELVQLPTARDGSTGYRFSAEINRQRYTFYIVIADTAQDTI